MLLHDIPREVSVPFFVRKNMAALLKRFQRDNITAFWYIPDGELLYMRWYNDQHWEQISERTIQVGEMGYWLQYYDDSFKVDWEKYPLTISDKFPI